MAIPKKVFTRLEIDRIEGYAAYHTIEDIAAFFGYSQSQFNRLKNQDINVMNAYKRGRFKALSMVGGKLMEQIENNNLTAIMFYLKTQGGWREKQDINVSNEDGSMKTVEQIYVKFVDDKDKEII